MNITMLPWLWLLLGAIGLIISLLARRLDLSEMPHYRQFFTLATATVLGLLLGPWTLLMGLQNLLWGQDE